MKILSILFLGLTLLGCATTAQLQLDPNKHEVLLVYPLIDGRNNKSIDIEDLGGGNQKAHPVSDYYIGRNYNCIARYANDLGIEPNISYIDLQTNNTNRLKNISTNGENFVLVIYLSQLQYAPGNVSCYGSMEAFLVRADIGKVIWSNSGKKTILLGMLGTVDRVLHTSYDDPAFKAYNGALTKTLRGFPVLQKHFE